MSSNRRHNNPPAVVLELDDDMVQFLIKNCDSNINLGLRILQRVHDGEDISESTVTRIIEVNEQFKALKKLINEALINNDRRI